MSILACYGEDIDFTSPGSISVNTSGIPTFRSGYARCALACTSGAKTLPFVGGAVTSAWLSFYAQFNSSATGERLIGLVNSATAGSGIWFGPSTSAANKAAIYKWDGTTLTQLAAEGGTSLGSGNANIFGKLDMQVVNYGSTSTVNLFVNGALVINYTGSTAISGVSDLDCVGLYFLQGGIGNAGISEVIVADEDTRSFSLFTMAPTAAGTTDAWTGAVTTINGTSYSDANPNYTNVAGQDQQADLTTPPTGTFGVKAVKIAARAAASVGSTPTKIALGFNQGGTVAVGTPQVLTNSYATYEQLDATNPVTSAAWAFSDLTGLQLDLRSST